MVVQLSLIKYADDSNIAIPIWKNQAPRTDLVEKFLCWTQESKMKCNPETCKELIISKKGFNEVILPLYDIPRYTSVVVLGMTFQKNGKFSMHVKANCSRPTGVYMSSEHYVKRVLVNPKLTNFLRVLYYLILFKVSLSMVTLILILQ